MADLAMGAMGSLIPKLGALLKEEYSLQTGVKERISNLTKELEVAQAALRAVAEVPWDQLDEHVQIWVCEVRESSYDMEDIVDTFLVRVQGPDSAEQEASFLKRGLKKMVNFFKKTKTRHKISGDVKDIISHLQEVTERCSRYPVNNIVARPATTSTINPHLHAMYNKVTNLVGIDKSSDELISMLQPSQRDDASNMKLKTVSIVGVGGLGKTTLARVVYDNLRGDFYCKAFVSVGRNPNLKQVLQMVLIALDKKRFEKFNFSVFQDITQFIDELREFLHDNKRYFIVIDDLWEVESWETIKFAIDDDNNHGGRILITTRKMEVAKQADEVYKLPPLPFDSSRKLLHTRIYGDERKYAVEIKPDEISDEIIRKCASIPLAIITLGSLLVDKPRDKWSEIIKSIGFGLKDNKEGENTMRILSFSYYDLPAHLRTCLLYFSAFAEDSVIHKSSLIWKWVAEGFVRKEERKRLFETGEGYFDILINRSMIQAVYSDHDESITIGCRVHDMVLDFIRSISREQNFFTVFDNNQDTLLKSNVHRLLANHKRTIEDPHQTNHFEMPKLRSFFALGCVIETWPPLSSFTLLRVLAIENWKPGDGSPARVEHLGHLRHLRFLSLSGTWINRIPKEIGTLSFLQTLDLWESGISELPSTSWLPKQLACLRISLCRYALDGGVFSVEGMTSLEELSIDASMCKTRWWHLKDLDCLRELRVLEVVCTELTKIVLVHSVRHLDNLQSLTIRSSEFVLELRQGPPLDDRQPRELLLPRHIRHLAVDIEFWKLPSCISPSCLPILSHLDLKLRCLDEQDLKILGGLPELHFLGLNLSSSSATMSISDSDACYFPKLRCCRLPCSMVLFVVANNGDKKSVSFHIWNGEDDVGIMPFVSDKGKLQSPRPSALDDELKSDDELQRPMPSVSDDENKCSSICSEGAAAAPPCFFMPSLQVLHFYVGRKAIEDHPNCCDNLGLEYLSSLEEINVKLGVVHPDKKQTVEAAVRRTAHVHPNGPTLRIR